MNMNEAGLFIMKDREGFSAKPYKCPAGVWTIGIGSTHYPHGGPVKDGDMGITFEQAIEYMNFELKDKGDTILSWAKKNNLTFTGNQFSALLCFAYNLGCGPIIDRERSMNQALLSKDPKKIRNAFMMYNKAKVKNWLGIWVMKSLTGLTIRRKMEADLFLNTVEGK